MADRDRTGRLQTWLGIAAVVFVFVYLGAIGITVSSRLKVEERQPVIESARVSEAERHLALPQLLLPMGIVLALSISYLVVRRRNARNYEKLDDDLDEPE